LCIKYSLGSCADSEKWQVTFLKERERLKYDQKFETYDQKFKTKFCREFDSIKKSMFVDDETDTVV